MSAAIVGCLGLLGFLDRLDAAPLETSCDSLPRLTEGWAVTAISERRLADGVVDHYLADALAPDNGYRCGSS
ncbi:MAG: hypothetical protein ABI336_01980 [Humibacillus sp.]